MFSITNSKERDFGTTLLHGVMCEWPCEADDELNKKKLKHPVFCFHHFAHLFCDTILTKKDFNQDLSRKILNNDNE